MILKRKTSSCFHRFRWIHSSAVLREALPDRCLIGWSIWPSFEGLPPTSLTSTLNSFFILLSPLVTASKFWFKSLSIRINYLTWVRCVAMCQQLTRDPSPVMFVEARSWSYHLSLHFWKGQKGSCNQTFAAGVCDSGVDHPPCSNHWKLNCKEIQLAQSFLRIRMKAEITFNVWILMVSTVELLHLPTNERMIW